jgi:hypothetical protein
MAWCDVFGWVRATAAFGVIGVSVALGQGAAAGAASMPPQTVEDALHEMSDAAGVIFAGQVLSVRVVPGSMGAPGVVEVTFRVDQAVHGCSAGGTYVLREWQGLWAAGDARYRVGQRLLMLLRLPGEAGLSSPVGGMEGAIPIRGVESQIGEAVVGAASVAGSIAAPEPMADLRWVGARLLRTASSAAGAGLVSAASVGTGSSGGVGSVASQGASVGTVVGLLSSWESARVAR